MTVKTYQFCLEFHVELKSKVRKLVTLFYEQKYAKNLTLQVFRVIYTKIDAQIILLGKRYYFSDFKYDLYVKIQT